VIFTAAAEFIEIWGIYPDQDPGKRAVRPQEVHSIKDSRSQLPAKFANELYACGETGMGYYGFMVVFASGLRQTHVTGDLVDFIQYPTGLTKNDVLSVVPNVRPASDSYVKGPEYNWCLYSK
jgi:hypothetical protein